MDWRWLIDDSYFKLHIFIIIVDPRPKDQPKHKLEKWFIISVDGVRPCIRKYVQNTPIKELNHFSS